MQKSAPVWGCFFIVKPEFLDASYFDALEVLFCLAHRPIIFSRAFLAHFRRYFSACFLRLKNWQFAQNVQRLNFQRVAANQAVIAQIHRHLISL